MRKTNCIFKFQKLALTMLCILLISVGLHCQDMLFWVSSNPQQVLCSNLNVTQVDIVTDSLQNPTGLGIDIENEDLYVGLTGDGNAIVKMNFDGTEVETIINTESGVSALLLDHNNGKIYYSLIFDDVIKRANLDGSNVETVITQSIGLNDFFIDFAESKVYWTEYFDGFIKRCNLDGTDIETLISDQLSPCHLFIDKQNNKIYWSNYMGNNINSSNLDGTDHNVLIDNLSNPAGITADIANNHIYWASFGSKSIKRANLDGTNIITLYTSNEEDILFWTLKSTIQIFSSSDNNLSSIPFELHQNFPNPFNPSTTIDFSLNNDSNVVLLIFNIKGQKIKTLFQNEFPQGSHSTVWDGDDESGNPVSSGVYYYQMIVNGKTDAVKKCLLLK